MLQACGSYVVVEPVYEKKTETGIFIPDGSEKQNGNFHGTVISVGPEYPYELKKGDKVLFRRNEGTELDFKLLALKKEWVITKLED